MSAGIPDTTAQSQLDDLAGVVERVTFHNGANSCCVLRLKVKGERELVTVIGRTLTVAPEEYASASGSQIIDREHSR